MASISVALSDLNASRLESIICSEELRTGSKVSRREMLEKMMHAWERRVFGRDGIEGVMVDVRGGILSMGCLVVYACYREGDLRLRFAVVMDTGTDHKGAYVSVMSYDDRTGDLLRIKTRLRKSANVLRVDPELCPSDAFEKLMRYYEER
jgi:hypothetical protein